MGARKFRKVGNRKLLVRPDEVEVATNGVWTLVEVGEWCQAGWTSLKLFRDEVGPKNLWQVGYKDGRLARNKGANLLQEHHPHMIEWVKEVTEKYLKTKKQKETQNDQNTKET